jgi:hypothetical protein
MITQPQSAKFDPETGVVQGIHANAKPYAWRAKV